MDYFDTFMFTIELISIVAFAASGAITAIQKSLDIFGVIILGITTSVGGGIVRDIIIGNHPPKSFNRPIYAIEATLVSIFVFMLEYVYSKHRTDTDPMRTKLSNSMMFWLDTVGISIFAVTGVAVGVEKLPDANPLVYVFTGVITAVGGGVMRDLFTGSTPYIFVKHFYACACISGSAVCILLWNYCGRIPSMLIGASVVFVLRVLAARYHWNMPKIEYDKILESAKEHEEREARRQRLEREAKKARIARANEESGLHHTDTGEPKKRKKSRKQKKTKKAKGGKKK